MNKIKELRKENNITVAELAKELGISQSMLTNYEMGMELQGMILYGIGYHNCLA
jgi:transcriptional regulator with XRE-family HTH domain